MIAKAIEQQLSPNYIIDVSKPIHVMRWAATLGVTEQGLGRAVNAVGVRAIEVFCYLRQEAVRSTERLTSPLTCSAKRGGELERADGEAAGRRTGRSCGCPTAQSRRGELRRERPGV